MSSITSANAVIALTIAGVFPTPVQLQGFAADDVFDTDQVNPSETLMGVDGILSAGFVFVPIQQNFSLQADSPSNFIFEQWNAQQQAAAEIFFANGIVTLTSINKVYVMRKGVLSGYKAIADGKRVLQPRRFSITWESIVPSPV
jgi:hypothetical protein